MGRKLVLTGTKLTDLTAPKLATIDPILPDAGALALFDPTHPISQWGTIDLNSTSAVALPNLAYAQALAMYPSGNATTLGGSYAKGVDFLNDSTASKVERTGKGGLHSIFSQTVGDTTKGNRTVTVSFGSGLNAYLLANKAHSFYFAYWGRLTRSSTVSGAHSHSQANSANDTWTFFTRPGASGDTQYPTTAARIGQFGESVLSTTGKTNLPIFQDVAISSSPAASITGSPFRSAAVTGTDGLKAASMIFYGFYAEDLTVSGRTYAQVNALVKAKYDKDVKTAGGRYYADTFTDPATIP